MASNGQYEWNFTALVKDFRHSLDGDEGSLFEAIVKPVSSEQPCGAEVDKTEDYRKITGEFTGRTQPNYARVADDAKALLLKTGKDFRAARYLCKAAFMPDYRSLEKLHQDLENELNAMRSLSKKSKLTAQDEADLKNLEKRAAEIEKKINAETESLIQKYRFENLTAGLLGLASLTEKSWASLHPQDPVKRSKAIAGIAEELGEELEKCQATAPRLHEMSRALTALALFIKALAGRDDNAAKPFMKILDTLKRKIAAVSGVSFTPGQLAAVAGFISLLCACEEEARHTQQALPTDFVDSARVLAVKLAQNESKADDPKAMSSISELLLTLATKAASADAPLDTKYDALILQLGKIKFGARMEAASVSSLLEGSLALARLDQELIAGKRKGKTVFHGLAEQFVAWATPPKLSLELKEIFQKDLAELEAIERALQAQLQTEATPYAKIIERLTAKLNESKPKTGDETREAESEKAVGSPGLLAETIDSEELAFKSVQHSASYWLKSNSSNPLPYLLSRNLRWTGIHDKLELAGGAKTKLASPPNEVRKEFQNLLEKDNPAEILLWCETEFCSGRSTMWLDLQRCIDEAAARLGEKYRPVSEGVRREAARLIEKIPNLAELTFSNSVRFADDKTRQWLEASVMPLLHPANGHAEATGDRQDEVEQEFQEAMKILQEKKDLQQALRPIREGLKKDSGFLSTFRRRLNMAIICVKGQNFLVALHILEDLEKQIASFSLDTLLPDLSTLVWKHLKKSADELEKSGGSTQEEKENYRRLSKRMFEKISKADIIEALNIR